MGITFGLIHSAKAINSTFFIRSSPPYLSFTKLWSAISKTLFFFSYRGGKGDPKDYQLHKIPDKMM